jgi:hypothetical protein
VGCLYLLAANAGPRDANNISSRSHLAVSSWSGLLAGAPGALLRNSPASQTPLPARPNHHVSATTLQFSQLPCPLPPSSSPDTFNEGPVPSLPAAAHSGCLVPSLPLSSASSQRVRLSQGEQGDFWLRRTRSSHGGGGERGGRECIWES